ncbi:MAG: hypothetical protein KIS74_03125 [Burkholderiales bacterium]|nr:hypothetical protein [Burkholderiales bacterium]
MDTRFTPDEAREVRASLRTGLPPTLNTAAKVDAILAEIRALKPKAEAR